jgi:uncharacterized protein (TIGR01777 family)
MPFLRRWVAGLPLWASEPISLHHEEIVRVLITGASGFIGTALSKQLETDGHEAIALERSQPAPGKRTWDIAKGRIDAAALEGIDAVVHLAGRSLDPRWSVEKRQDILSSRVEGTDLIARAVAEAKPSVFVSGSAIGFYGSRGDEVLSEESERGAGFLSDVVVAWEAATRPAEDAGVRTVKIRTSLVLHPSGGAFPRMVLPFKLGMGGPMGGGRQWWAWITLEDEVRAIAHCITNSAVSGPVNLAAPEPVRNADFTRALGSALHRPAVVPIPAFALKTILGADAATELLLSSQRVVPSKLVASGFEFNHPTIDRALSAIL